MEMRTVPVTYQHYEHGERVQMTGCNLGIQGTVVAMVPPTHTMLPTVVVKWDQSYQGSYRPEEIELVPEPPITNDERMAAILTCDSFLIWKSGDDKWCTRHRQQDPWGSNTAEKAVDEFVRWYRRQQRCVT